MQFNYIYAVVLTQFSLYVTVGSPSFCKLDDLLSQLVDSCPYFKLKAPE